MSARWTVKNIPDLTGKTAVVTGANGGLGVVTCRELAARGAKVIMACRNQAKGQAAMVRIKQRVPAANLVLMPLDLGDLTSIRAFAKAINEHCDALDLLINNAGIIAMPLRRTKDGFESQMGVNCLGHFALAGLLLAQLQRSLAARVVSVGTSSHPQRAGKIDLNDLNWTQRRYHSLRATLQAKLAFQVWTFELNRRLQENGISQLQALVAHPGIAETNISLAGAEEANARVSRLLLGVFNKTCTQSADKGALPTLYAATAPEAKGGDFIGPRGLFEMWGYPKPLRVGPLMRDSAFADALWTQAESLTQVAYLS